MDNVCLEGAAATVAAPQLFSVPRIFVEEYGANAGYLLGQLVYSQEKANDKPYRIIEGKAYFFRPSGRTSKRTDKHYCPLQDRMPWITRQGLHKLVRKLEAAKAIKVARNANKRRYDKTLSFHVTNKRCDAAKSPAVWFDPAEAKNLGIAAAIVLNLIYRDFHLRKAEHLILSRKAIARETGLPVSTVADAFKLLQERKYISTAVDISGKKVSTSGVRLLVPNPCRMKALGKGHKYVSTIEHVSYVSSKSNPYAVAAAPATEEEIRACYERGESALKLLRAKKQVRVAEKKSKPKKRVRRKKVSKEAWLVREQIESRKEMKTARRVHFAIREQDDSGEMPCNPMLMRFPRLNGQSLIAA